MNPIKERFRDRYKTVEPYLAIKLEVTIVLTLLITIASIFINSLLALFQLVTFSSLLFSLKKVKGKYPEKIKTYIAVFTPLYLSALLLPYLTTLYGNLATPQGMYTILVILLTLMVLFLAIRIIKGKKGVKAKVILSDEENAVIRPKYNLLSGLKPKRYVIDNRGAQKGDIVRIKLSKTPFKKPRPKKIKEVIG